MSNNRNWLIVAEYISIAGSLLGSAVAVVSQQAIYGLAPVSLSLVLNAVNRHRLEQLTQQRSAASSQVQQLKSAIDSLSLANAKLKQDVQNVVPKQELTSIVSKVEELNQQQKGLRLSLVPLQSRLDDLIEQFNKRPELEQIESLAAVITALKQCIDELPQPERSQQDSAKFQQQVESALAHLSRVSTRVKQLEQAIAQVQRQLDNLD
jgi:chromosome segregation ATPase